MNRPATYAKHVGRKQAQTLVQLDIFASGPPKEMPKPAPRVRRKPEPRAAAAPAEAAVPGWNDIAIEAIRLAISTAGPRTRLTIEQLRARVEDGIPPPPMGLRQWGTVARTCRDREILEWTGSYAPSAARHGSPAPVYKAGPKAGETPRA